MNRQHLLIARELGDRRAEARSLVSLGATWGLLGEGAQARLNYEEGLRLARAVGDRTYEPPALGRLSVLALWQGDDALALAHAQSALDIAIDVQDRGMELNAWCWLGDAELALGRYPAAAAAFDRAHAVALAVFGKQGAESYAKAGLARVALAQGDAAGALLAVETVLAHLAGGGTLDITESSQIRLTCYQVLQRALDARAVDVLAAAHTEMQARAAKITDATLRHGFLNNIPEHRDIVKAWTAQQAVGAGEH